MAKTLNILIVTKDVAEYLIYSVLASALRSRGHKVTVVAEGLSLDKWLGEGEEIFFGRPKEAFCNQKTRFRNNLSPSKILKMIRPDLVLTGLGAPINLGEKFGIVANIQSIKLGYITDVWGVETRSQAMPNFICTLDTVGEKLIKSHKWYRFCPPRVYVTGSPAMDRLTSVKPDEYVSTVAARYDLSVLLVGQDESTTPVIEGLLEALGKLTAAGKRPLLIPRLHPKFLAREDLQRIWLVALTKAPCDVLWFGNMFGFVPIVSTTQLMCSADITVSTYSNALIEAAALGSTSVSWVSDVGREKMRGALGGLERFPLVDYGCAVEVSTANEFIAITSEQRDMVCARCKEVFPNDGKNIERVVAAIEKEFDV
ncbi:MAG: hypothetical protein Q7R65_02910 [bacterium]|nr:hypothetical protein [bacterium]